jgi:hypothetical protein
MKAKKPTRQAKSASKKVAIKDLKTKDAGTVKGGAGWDLKQNKKLLY